ncbi:hypothetical protein R6Q57_007063 [Mikania cordata]
MSINRDDNNTKAIQFDHKHHSLYFLVKNEDASGPLPTPDSPCCRNIKEQHGCFCGYLKDPKYCSYLVKPLAKQVGTACGVQTPDLSACKSYSGSCPRSNYQKI